MLKPPSYILTLPNTFEIVREIYKDGQLIPGEKLSWRKTTVGKFNFENTKFRISEEEGGVPKMTIGQIRYYLSEDHQKVTIIDGELVGNEVTLRGITHGHALRTVSSLSTPIGPRSQLSLCA